MIPGTRPARRSARAAPLPARERVAALIELTVAIVYPRLKSCNAKGNSASASRGAGDAAEACAYNGAPYGTQGNAAGYGGAVIARVRVGSKADVVVWSRRTHMDKTSKVIFALIAAGLWFDTASNLLRPAHAQQDMLSDIKVSVQLISRSLETLVSGGLNCTN